MKYLRLSKIFLPVVCILLCGSCSKWTVPAAYLGKWKSDPTKITVRTEPRKMKFEFTSTNAIISLDIREDKTVTGRIGDAQFIDGKLKKNRGLPPSVTGVSYIIECGSIGKIYEQDPLATKHVEIWLIPIKEPGLMEAELRFTENKSTFPMAGMVFRKE